MNIDWQWNSDIENIHSRYAYFVYLIKEVFTEFIDKFF
jgi:hypothetical protein